jgi:CRP-like cAMP-binding protein
MCQVDCLGFALSRVKNSQELIANMLGVRREGLTEFAGRLQKAGLISYASGKIEVLDRLGLEHRSFECYGAMKQNEKR